MEAFSWIAIVAALLMGIFLGRRRARLEEAPQSKPAVHHESEMADIHFDIKSTAVEEHAAKHGVDPEKVMSIIDLADRTRY